MSVQIDNLMDVDAILLGSVWIDVDLGTLRRASSRGSGAGVIELYWRSGERVYVANAGEVNAVRMIIPEPVAEPEPQPKPEHEAVVDAVVEAVAEAGEDPEPELDPNSMMAALKRARETRADSDDEAEEDEDGEPSDEGASEDE